ncbi:MAG TPA: putative zinc-binding protein [Steroidobacteraceae bacterium]|nr:putative zinc-binding protein [Steroidobacteraceae bacterium]
MSRPAHSAYRSLPLVYSCSGCSSAAQLANHVAVRLDRQGLAEMSCIAGVGGDVDSLVRTAAAGRRIIALDGCPLQCVKNCLRRHGIAPTLQYTLSELGIRKRYHADFDVSDADRVIARVRDDLASPQPA